MIDDIAKIPTDILFLALEDITGAQLERAGSIDNPAIMALLEKILNNPERTEQFAERVALYGMRSAAAPAEVTAIRWRTMRGVLSADDPMADDYPSHAQGGGALPFL